MTRLNEAGRRTPRKAAGLVDAPARHNNLKLEPSVDDSAGLAVPGRAGEALTAPSGPGQRLPATSAERSRVRARRFMRIGWVVALAAAGVLVYYLAGASGSFGTSGPIRLTGVVAANQVAIASEIAGRIKRVAVQEGSWVKQGDLMVLLDRDELEAEWQHQLALIEQLSAKLRQAQDVVTLEGDRGRGHVASAEAQWQVAQSQREEAAASLEQFRKDAQRLRKLSEDGLVSRQDVERADTEVRVAEARLKSVSDQAMRAEADLELARTNERQTDVAQGDVEQAQAELQQANARLDQLATRLRYTEVRAPLSGMVSVQLAREGEVIGAGSPIVTLVDLDDVWVRAQVEESYLGLIGIGQELDVEVASGGRLKGWITFIAPEAEFATQRDVSRVKRDIRTFGIKVAVPNPDRRLHQGMTAYAWLPEPASAR